MLKFIAWMNDPVTAKDVYNQKTKHDFVKWLPGLRQISIHFNKNKYSRVMYQCIMSFSGSTIMIDRTELFSCFRQYLQTHEQEMCRCV